MQNIHAGKQCHKNVFLICNSCHFFCPSNSFLKMFSRSCWIPAFFKKPLSSCPASPEVKSVWSAESPPPTSYFPSEGEGAPPHPSCLLREQFAAGDAILHILAASLGGYKVAWMMMVMTLHWHCWVEKKGICGLSPPFSWAPSLLSSLFF